MIETLLLGPRPAMFHGGGPMKVFWKWAMGSARSRIARGHDAPLAGIVAVEPDLPDLERAQLPRLSEEMVLPERFDPAEFKIAAEPAARAFERESRVPARDFLQAGLARDRRARRAGVVGEGRSWLRNGARRRSRRSRSASHSAPRVPEGKNSGAMPHPCCRWKFPGSRG